MVVMYTSQENVWKIADFGISSEGTSRNAVTTIFGRGTGGYRAPELINQSAFTNKVDIWALGCILIELTTGQKAFKEDWDVRTYLMSPSDTAPWVLEVPALLRPHSDEMIEELLHRDHQRRPRAAELFQLFRSYLEILDDSVVQTLEDAQSIPPYPEWKEMVGNGWAGDELLSCLATWYISTGNRSAAKALREEVVFRNPDLENLRQDLKAFYHEIGDINTAIEGWRDLVNRCPSNAKLNDELAAACKEKGDVRFEVTVWSHLAGSHPGEDRVAVMYADAVTKEAEANRHGVGSIQVVWGHYFKHPTNIHLRKALQKSLQSEGNEDMWGRVSIWKELLAMNPDDDDVANGLAESLLGIHKSTRAALYWRDLVLMKPDNQSFIDGLAKSLGDTNEAIEVWRELVIMKPDNQLVMMNRDDQYFIGRLSESLADRDALSQAMLWKESMLTNPDNPRILKRLAECLVKIDIQTQAAVWKELLAKNPDNHFFFHMLVESLLGMDKPIRAAVWKKLLSENPNNHNFLSTLLDSNIGLNQTIEEAICKELVEMHPTSLRLRSILETTVSDRILLRITVWEGIVQNHPEDHVFRNQLRASLEHEDKEIAKIVWKNLVAKHPNELGLVRGLRGSLGYYDTSISKFLWNGLDIELVYSRSGNSKEMEENRK